MPRPRGNQVLARRSRCSSCRLVSFELAAHRLSADVINVSASSSSLTKGETLKDTAKVFEANHADIIVLRHSSAGASQFLAERLDASIINAGDGAHEHPTQALLDTFTIREKLGRIAGIHVAIIGDILFSRVARSNIHALLKLGARVTLVGPSTLVPREFEPLGVTVTHKLDDVIEQAGRAFPMELWNVTQVEIVAYLAARDDKPSRRETFTVGYPNSCSLKYDEIGLKLRAMLVASKIESQ